MNTFILSTTKGKKEDTLLYQSNKHDYDIFFKENNSFSLAKNYNKAIDFAIKERFEYLVLCHDDIIIETDIYKKIPKIMENFDVVGVAGTTECKLQKPALWHIMGGGFNSGNLYGAVAHGNADKKQMTTFGHYPQRVLLIDGVFMCIKRNVFKEVRFDEECPSKFHFYDLDYSLSCHEKGYKIGVSDIIITHSSPGLKEFTPEFLEGEEWFLNKWKGRL